MEVSYNPVKTVAHSNIRAASDSCGANEARLLEKDGRGRPLHAVAADGNPGSEWSVVHLAFALSVIGFLISTSAAISLAVGMATASSGAAEVNAPTGSRPGAAPGQPPLGDGTPALEPGVCWDEMMNQTAVYGSPGKPYTFLTGAKAHRQPDMYGHVMEKTIWLFWHDREHCPTSARCRLPAYVRLCLETIRLHKGSFDVRFVYADTADRFVSMTELPLHWRAMAPHQQRDALMSALLARYGGVALDVSAILLRPLDGYWDEMVSANATFRGYMYRLNGQPWGLLESTATWFMMSRREGLFSTVVRDQRTGMCRAHRHPGLRVGDRTLTPVLGMFNYSLPRCSRDPAVADLAACPELAQPDWTGGATGPARNDRRLLLEDPRDGPQLPFSRADSRGVALWSTNSLAKVRADDARFARAPLGLVHQDLAACNTMSSCWNEVFMQRFHSKLPFVVVFDAEGQLERMGLKDLLADNDSYFYHWLRLARGGAPLTAVAPASGA